MTKRGYMALAAAGLVIIAAVSATLVTLKGSAAPQRQAVRNYGGATMGLAVAPAAYDSASYSKGAIAVGESAAAPSIAPMPPIDQSAGQTAAEVDQKIIKNGSLQLVVDDVAKTSGRITDLAKQQGGFVQSSNISERADGTHSGYVTIRVPASVFESTMAEIKTYALTVKSENASGQDVTEKYTDLQAQLHNAQAQEATYLEVLKKAQTVEDILKVQQRLGEIRGTIESLQGRIKYLENVTSYSTISVTLEEEPVVQVPTKEFRPWTVIKEATKSLVEAFQSMVVSLIWIVIMGGGLLLPFAILALIIWLIWRAVKRRHQK